MRPRDVFTIGSAGAYSPANFSVTYLESSTTQYLFYENQAFPNPSYTGTVTNALNTDASGNINYLGVFSMNNILIQVDTLQLTNTSTTAVSTVSIYFQTPANPAIKIPIMVNIQIPINSTVFLSKDDIDMVMKPYYTLASTGKGEQSGYGITMIASAASTVYVTGQARYIRSDVIS